MSRTTRFVDTNKDGVDDNNTQGDGSEEFDKISRGYENFGSTFSDNFFQPVDKDYDRMTNLQTGMYADQVGKNMDMARSEQQADFGSGLYKDNSLFGANLEMRNNRENRADTFEYGMRSLDKQFELTNEYADRSYGRNIGTMAAQGEQTRKNYRAEGVENRLGTVTQGEQQRLGMAAQGDQDRKSYEFEDNINARGEARNKSRALGLARGF
tara:strand:+ start:198 stop:830 length:633 start_codon:yes stop_codon:yes gene_type:complete